MGIPQYVARRCVQAIPSIIVVTIIVFFLVRLTGDPASLLLGEWATQEGINALRQKWGLDDPVLVQYGRYLRQLLSGDLGTSMRYPRSVASMILEGFGASAKLVFASVAISVVVAVPLGIMAAVRWQSMVDVLVRVAVVFGQAIPRFYLGVILMLLFGVYLRWLPTSGYGTSKHLVLPAITLATPTAVLLTRLIRSSVLDALHQDYVRTARSKGLGERVVLYKHVLRNALISPITVMATQAAELFGGSVVVETVFGYPGLGRLAVGSVYTRDFPLIQGIVLTFSLIVVAANIAVDVAYAIIDPRMRS